MSNHNEAASVESTSVSVEDSPRRKMAIPNVARLSDEALRHALVRQGVEVPEWANRDSMIQLAKSNGLWNYTGTIVPVEKKRAYAANGGNCGDQLAAAFGDHGKDPDFLRSVAMANGIDFDRWSHCNIGQKRMNLGNVLRAKIKRGEYVIVNTTEWEGGVVLSE